MAFELSLLPYAYDALEPYMSQKTLEFHHDEYHATCVSILNVLVKETEFADKSLEDIILKTYGDRSKADIFNNAAQVWNHNFFWNCMKPNGGGQPNQWLAEKLIANFDSLDRFAAEFRNVGTTQFSNGYAWLVLDRDRLKVVRTGNAMNPTINKQIPLLGCDVWEHAYCLDYQNRRFNFIQAFLEHLVNWEFVTQQLRTHELTHT
ncbi:superoxide dismutase [Pleurocapsa sp. FMAR1]|uniref:superoxide dismutase n=1 Tax=Pleurocapsa sp. FMAR1 TaxID=3040204 RepID=UPI0029C9253A|nr:superoxide dismutase [Pleurocapsa sp. FMAR1]